MKLISNLDVNGNKFISVNGTDTLELVMPEVGSGTGTITKTIATHDEVEAVITRFAGAFQFKGEAIRIKETEGVKDYTTIIVAGEEEGTVVEIVAANSNRGNVYQIGDKEYASDGTEWVELGFNIQKASASVDGLMSKEDFSKLSGMEAGAQVNKIETVKVNGNALAIDAKAVNIDLSAYDTITAAQGREATLDGKISANTTAINTLQGNLEEAEEVTAAALNDLDSRATGLATRMTAAEGDITTLKGSTVKSVALGNNTAIAPDSDGKVTITAATDSADGYMAAADHAKLSEIAEHAQVNVIEGVKLEGAAAVLPLDSKVATIPNASASGNGLMTALDFSKLADIEEGAQANVQADWTEADPTSDAYIANKPTNLAATYVYTPTAEQYTAKTVTISAAAHKCGLWPLVQVYYGMDIVSANVSVVLNESNHDVTVSWEVAADSNNPIHIRIVG